ncbi:MAG: terminase small subunit [Hyphomicrobiales bacterium]
MTEHLPQPQKDDDRKDAPLGELREFPDPLDQQLVDAMLRDPLLSAAEHIQALTGNKYASMKSAATQAWRRLNKPVVQAYMRHRQERLRRAAELETEDLQQHLTMIINSDITQVAQWNDQGRVKFAASDALPTHVRRAVKKLKTKVTTRHFEQGGSEETVTTELEMYDRQHAIELFAKLGGMLKGDGPAVNVQNGVILMPAPETEEQATKGKTIYEG